MESLHDSLIWALLLPNNNDYPDVNHNVIV